VTAAENAATRSLFDRLLFDRPLYRPLLDTAGR